MVSEKDLFAFTAKESGCPQGQIENFLRFGYVPQPKQLIFHSAARKGDSVEGPDEIGFGGARGPGKSHAIFAQMALDDCQRAKGVKCLYLRKIGKQAKEQLEDLRVKVLFACPHKYNRHEGVITFPQWNNSRILLGHFKDERDIEAYLGLEYDVIGIEESTTLTLEKYKALRDSNRTSRTDFRPRVYNSTNPGGRGHVWYKKRFIEPWKRKKEKYTKFIPATLEDNKFIDGGYQRRVEDNTGWKLRAHRYGDWDIAAGQFFDSWSEVHILPSDYPIEPWWNKFGGYDHGHNHPYMAGFYASDGDGNVIKFAECGDRGRKSDQIYPEMVQSYLEGIGKSVHEVKEEISDGKEVDRITVYAGHDIWSKPKDGDGPMIVEKLYKLSKEGLVKFSFVQANISRIHGANHLRDYLDWRQDDDGNLIKRPRLYIKENCWRTIQQIPAMIHDDKNLEDVLKVDATEDDVWCGDDAYDETRYAMMSRPRISKKEQAPIKKRSGAWFMEKALENQKKVKKSWRT